MLRGAITGYIDVAQLTLYAFFIFFGFLVFYLRREDKREGYPLESDRSRSVVVQGWPSIPRPKIFRLGDGRIVTAPRLAAAERVLNAAPAPWPGSPLQPLGDPMRDGVGPAAYANREDVPEEMFDGSPLIVPMRTQRDTGIAVEDVDPRGMTVVGADKAVAGTVTDLWVDRAEPQVRYIEVAVAAAADVRNVLVPMPLARISKERRIVKVASITAAQFLGAPALQNPDRVTKREEDKISAYFGSGHLYATPSRLGPLL